MFSVLICNSVLVSWFKIIFVNEKKNCFFEYDKYASSSITGLVSRRAPMSGLFINDLWKTIFDSY